MPDPATTTTLSEPSAATAGGFALPLDAAARRRLHERDPAATARAFALTLAGLAAVFGLALGVGGALGVLAAFLLAIAVQTRMAVLMHEGAHGLVARDRARNDAVTDWLAAWPIGMSVERYRRNHLPHHTALGTPEDPDFVALCLPPIEHGLGWSVRGCLLGMRHVELLLKYVRGDRGGEADAAGPGTSARSTLTSVAGRALWQGALFGLCLSSGQAWIYFAVWLLPLLTVAVLINELRSIVEHTPLVPPLAAGESWTLEPIAMRRSSGRRTKNASFASRKMLRWISFV